MKHVCIISKELFLEEVLSSCEELNFIKFKTEKSHIGNADLYIKESEAIDYIEGKSRFKNEISVETPIKVTKIVEQIKSFFRTLLIIDNDIILDLQSRTLSCGKNFITLTEVECKIIYLLKQADQALSKNMLERKVLGYNKGVTSSSIENHIYNLRQKIKQLADTPLILTKDGGYAVNNDMRDCPQI
jgi:DNA-binding winged helix-turn-helix (wHTH) protein